MNFRYWLKGKPKYCSKCGERLYRSEKVSFFDNKTGAPKSKTVVIKCPRFMLFNNHANYEWTEEIE